MSVAPSFVNFEFLCEPYLANGKMYIRVRNPKTGTERQVRWYEEKKTSIVIPKVSFQEKPQKEALGFTKGYITIFKGDVGPHIEWFQQSIARYARTWGWYIISTEEIPSDLPAGVEPIKLFWESVGNENGRLKLENEVKEAVEALIYDESPSEFIGSIGDRIEIDVKVIKNIALENQYGNSTMHIFEDACGNQYVWTTSAKNWSEGSEKFIRGSVKDHRTYKGIKQTILNRCVEV